MNSMALESLDADRDVVTLFDGPILWFADWPHHAVPRTGSLVYTVWRRDGAFLYVGMAGRSLTRSPASKGPYGRLESHASGMRSGDQFCIYVCDRLVLPRLGNRLADIAEGAVSLDRETRSYIRDELGFRWLASAKTRGCVRDRPRGATASAKTRGSVRHVPCHRPRKPEQPYDRRP